MIIFYEGQLEEMTGLAAIGSYKLMGNITGDKVIRPWSHPHLLFSIYSTCGTDLWTEGGSFCSKVFRFTYFILCAQGELLLEGGHGPGCTPAGRDHCCRIVTVAILPKSDLMGLMRSPVNRCQLSAIPPSTWWAYTLYIVEI